MDADGWRLRGPGCWASFVSPTYSMSGCGGRPLLQPSALPEIPERRDRAGHHQHDRKRVAEVPVELWQDLEVHAIDAGDQRRRQEGDRGHREDLDDLVLVDVDEADRGIHQEVDLVEQEGSVAVERLDVAQDLPRLLELAGTEHAAAHHE